MPAPVPPPKEAEIGVLLVHGIGDHKEGETLVGFGEPVFDWLRDWLRAGGDAKSRGRVRVTEARLRATRTEAVSPAYARVEIELFATAAEAAQSERWLVAEAWWGDSVQPPRTLRLLIWLLTRGPLLIYWHFYLGKLRTTGAGLSQRQLMFAGVAFILAALLQAVVLIAMTLWLIPFGPWRRAVADAVRALTLTLGDSFVLLEQDFQSAALVRRVERALDWLGERASKLIVIAHSQGGAIAHEALRRLKTDRVAAFISVGSGLEKLHFLRHVRDKRGGLVAASLLVPLALIGAPLLFAGVSAAASERWMAGIGGLAMMGVIGSLAVLINALDSYRRELDERMAELDLRPALGAAQWHDLHATRDVVPMGEGSLMGRLDFVTRGELENQRSYLNDHVAYFENRLGFLPLLWQLLACHCALPLFRDADTQALAAAVRRHGRHVGVLWAAGLANWAALGVALYAMLDSLAGFGGSVLAALDGIGLAALAKPVRGAGSALGWLAQRAGVFGPEVDAAARVTPPLLGALTLVGVIIAWFALFRAGWLLRAAADWRKVCRTRRAGSPRRPAWDAATLALWAGFALTPLLAAIVFAAGPSAQTWQLLTRSVAGVLSVMCIAVAFVYAAGTPWAGTAADERLWLPPGSLLLVAGGLWAANWFWPEGWNALPMRTLTGLVWLGMALSWLAWLLRRGIGVYGRLGAAGLIVLPPIGAVVLRVWWLPTDTPVGWLQALAIGIVAAVTAVEAVRSRALLIELARGQPPLRWLWPQRPLP